jgi:hypothetical protein
VAAPVDAAPAAGVCAKAAGAKATVSAKTVVINVRMWSSWWLNVTKNYIH